MPIVVGVRFREAGKLYHFEPGPLALHRLDKVVVETANGTEIGRVVTEPLEKGEEDLVQPVRRVVRKTTAQDLQRQEQNKARALDALSVAKHKVAELQLQMRLVEAELSLDRNRLTLYFTAEERVDFRSLVRELAQAVRARVELRQVGARDEAKLLDGIGPCGQQLCCTRWLTAFQPVSIKMAKLQNLSLNPGKLAGVCGRLKCCLRYEVEQYEEGQKTLPPLGAVVYTREGEGRVVGTDVLARTVSVLFDAPTPQVFDVDEVFSHACGGGPDGEGCTCGGKNPGHHE